MSTWKNGLVKCDVCGKFQPYAAMLTYDKWHKVIQFYNISSKSLLCMDCMEKGLERPFSIDDFTSCALNVKWGII